LLDVVVCELLTERSATWWPGTSPAGFARNYSRWSSCHWWVKGSASDQSRTPATWHRSCELYIIIPFKWNVDVDSL